jgi:DNA-binding CsgD family transcriptional regulator
VEIALGVAMLALSLLLAFRALGIWFSDAVVWPLVLVAAGGGGDLVMLERAAAALGLGMNALASAEGAGLITVADGAAEFRHPLIRSAVYGNADPQERREAHAALAGALPDRDVDRRAWHLAAAALGADAAASDALEQAGQRARERGAYTVAAAAFERAARIAPDERRRSVLLWESANAAWSAGLAERAVALLDEACDPPPDEELADRIAHLRGHARLRLGPVREGYEILTDVAGRVARRDPELAVVILAEAAHACFYSGAAEDMLSTAGRAMTLVPPDASRRARFFASSALGTAQVLAGDGEAGAKALREAVAILEDSDELREDPRLLGWAALGPLFLREAEAGRALIDRALSYARERSGAGTLPHLLHLVARDHAMSDAWSAAHAQYDEAAGLARESGQRSELAAALAGVAWLEGRQGIEAPCRAHAEEGRALCRELGMGLYEVWTVVALGELELGLGRPEIAASHFEEQRLMLERHGIVDVDVSPVPELVDVYLRLGRPDEAAALVDDFEERARAKGQPWSLARAARCRGLVAGEDELDRWFGEAIALGELTPDLFERARTHLAYGARLRRARKRVRAREELRAALELLDRLGQTPWRDLASAELAATGETARRRDPSTLDDLTPQELQIALLLAEGKTTRQAAAALFLSPKTIEYHLRHVYRKLGIRSREELAAAFATARVG